MHTVEILELLLYLLALVALLIIYWLTAGLLKAYNAQQKEAEAAHLITLQGTAENAAENGTESIEDAEGTGSID
ncbi:hypothetical protein HMPREF2942_00870 [Rothia sp. HMSC071C12]|jgi:hypothetical protein|uniref:hypothetical protein n=1 Tax=Rothia sp. HMSC071C12 TaxID=1739446 RepID=UPI0008A40421|nr:hypothetical protein [Rothia sp. HMSC071C12]OFQ33885.1 hypothetical protein HMPREF2942_00870 [Rothia sp. HMSC071C12]